MQARSSTHVIQRRGVRDRPCLMQTAEMSPLCMTLAAAKTLAISFHRSAQTLETSWLASRALEDGSKGCELENYRSEPRIRRSRRRGRRFEKVVARRTVAGQGGSISQRWKEDHLSFSL